MRTNYVYQGDCIELLKSLPSNSIDSVITDPPYNINLKPQRGLTDSIQNDDMSEEEFTSFLENVFTEINRVLKEDSFLIIFTGWSTIPLFRNVLDKLFTLKSMPIWVKNNFGIGYYTRPQYEPCFLYLKGSPKPLEKPVSDVWHFNRLLAPEHSCQKPVKMMRFIVKTFTKENDIVLDPFAGSGSTIVACKQTNRRWVGAELEGKYIGLINKQLGQDTLSGFFQTQGVLSEPSFNRNLKETSQEVSQISADAETSLNKNIHRLRPNFEIGSLVGRNL